MENVRSPTLHNKVNVLREFRLLQMFFLFLFPGIYEMFCRELFGKKPQKLDFGLQPHKIPDCDVVSDENVSSLPYEITVDFYVIVIQKAEIDLNY